MQRVRLDKSIARRLVVEMAPEYLEMLRELQTPTGRRNLAEGIRAVRSRLKLDGYVVLYEDDQRLLAALALALWTPEELKVLNQASSQEQIQMANELANELMVPGALDEMFPTSDDKLADALKQFDALAAEEKQQIIKRSQYLFSFFICFFYNMLSVMVHGERLTSLVRKANEGNRDAFLKAIQIDKFLLRGHAAFVEQYEDAQVRGEEGRDFLAAIGNRIQAPPTKGKIRYPGVYCVFAMLEALDWLHEMSDEEILDICDDARLDRWQNRIEDVNYLTKRRISYRRMQMLGGLSMH